MWVQVPFSAPSGVGFLIRNPTLFITHGIMVKEIVMDIYEINDSNVCDVARLMSEIKPDWWDYEGARSQLRQSDLLAKLVGWYISDGEKVKGWILCAEFEGYSYLSIENLGYDEDGSFVMEEQIEPLLSRAERHARSKGFRNLKYIISSIDMSCDGRVIDDYGDELKRLKSNGRKHFDYFVSYGFVATGFIPNCYGEGRHGIVMVKSLM